MAHFFQSRWALTLPLLLLLAIVLASCDSGDPNDPDPQATTFLVRYELTGTCYGIQVYAYNVTVAGAVEGSSGTLSLPWSFEHTVEARTSPTATALSATCQGNGESAQTLSARILANGAERASQTATGTDQIAVTIGANLR